jgi:hypothetical protein
MKPEPLTQGYCISPLRGGYLPNLDAKQTSESGLNLNSRHWSQTRSLFSGGWFKRPSFNLEAACGLDVDGVLVAAVHLHGSLDIDMEGPLAGHTASKTPMSNGKPNSNFGIRV